VPAASRGMQCDYDNSSGEETAHSDDDAASADSLIDSDDNDNP
jgi:hypothetical protein